MKRRFLTLADVSEILNVSSAQAYALVRNRDLRAIKVGGRGQWRIAESDLDEYIERMYAETEVFLTTPDPNDPPTDAGASGADADQ